MSKNTLIDTECICRGNWRKIVAEAPIGDIFHNKDGEIYTLIGVMDGQDDYYYVMSSSSGRKYEFLSCVGAIEDMGFTKVVL